MGKAVVVKCRLDGETREGEKEGGVTLSYLATISARSWSSFTAASCSVSDAAERERREESVNKLVCNL